MALLTVVVFTVIPLPPKLTVAFLAKFVPVSTTLPVVVPSVPLLGETLVSVGASTAVEYVPVKVPLTPLEFSTQMGLFDVGEAIGVVLPGVETVSPDVPVKLQLLKDVPWSEIEGA